MRRLAWLVVVSHAHARCTSFVAPSAAPSSGPTFRWAGTTWPSDQTTVPHPPSSEPAPVSAALPLWNEWPRSTKGLMAFMPGSVVRPTSYSAFESIYFMLT